MNNPNTIIEDLKNQLLTLGYHPSQLNQITEDEIGMKDLTNINSMQADCLIASLENYIRFALKCKNSKLR
ncbi:MAG: hypothetical protein H6Q68_2707 [Firmicutes bacterium]|nr:hypothetical protein [Bacillota bacterium]